MSAPPSLLPHAHAHAVQAATEAMLAAGFGQWEPVGDDGEDGQLDELAGGGPMHGHNLASQLALATQHTATAASSLSALPSQAFFASLRVGQGVDAVDIIGYPQWRHAVILDSRQDEFLIRWAGWVSDGRDGWRGSLRVTLIDPHDPKWDEWVHCLRLAPAHSHVLGDTGPEDSAEKTLAAVFGNEWGEFRRRYGGWGADVQVTIEGRPPWSILQQQQQRQHAPLGAVSTAPPSSPPPRHPHAPSPPSGRAVYSATPPSHSYASAAHGAPSYASLDDEEEHTFALSDPGQRTVGSMQYAHECFLRVRCPRIFKFERDAAAAHAAATAAPCSAAAAAVPSSPASRRLGVSGGAGKAVDGADMFREPVECKTPGFDRGSKGVGVSGGSRTAPASSIASATAAVAAEARQPPPNVFGGSMKLPMDKKRGQHRLDGHANAVVLASAVPATPASAHGPPSARMAKSASSSATLLRSSSSSGAHTARSAAAAAASPALMRHASATHLTHSPTTATGAKAAARRSPGGGAPLSPPHVTRSGSTPGSTARRLFAPVASAAASAASLKGGNGSRARASAGSPASSSTAHSRSRTPTASAPVTPRLRPSSSPKVSPMLAGVRSDSGDLALTHARGPPHGQAKRKSVPAATASPMRTSRATTSSSQAASPAAPSSSPSQTDDPRSSPSSAGVRGQASSCGSEDDDVADHTSLPEQEQEQDQDQEGDGSHHPSPSATHTSLLAPSDAAAMESPSATLFPKDATPQEECKKSHACSASPTSPATASPSSANAASSPPASRIPPLKLLVLPLSSPKAMAALLEYAYTDAITHTAVGDRHQRASAATTDADAATASSKPPRNTRDRRNGRRDVDEWDESAGEEDEVASAMAAWGSASSASAASATGASSASSVASLSSSSPMDVLDLLQLACMASSLHDARLMALCALHLQRCLAPGNIMSVLRVLDVVGALKHKQEREKHAAQSEACFNVNLNGSLAPPKSDHATHPTQNKSGRSTADAPTGAHATSSPSIPPSFLLPDTPASFLRTGSLSLCGPTTHDLDLVTRVVFDHLILHWNAVFEHQGSGNGAGGGESNMQALHSMPFATFSMIVNLKNSVSAGTGPGGEPLPPPYQFKSVEEKAIFAQAQINAALIAAGLTPTHAHNLFNAAHLLHGGHVAGYGVGGASLSHEDMLRIVASPSIALPACGLVKVMRRMYEARSEGECDCRILIEEDGIDEQQEQAGSLAAPSSTPRRVLATFWAHRIVLAWGSDYFRTLFGGSLPSNSGWGPSAALEESLTSAGRAVSVVRFPRSFLSPPALQAVLKYIYTNDAPGPSPSNQARSASGGATFPFSTALQVLRARVTNFFGLREYVAGVGVGHSAPATAEVRATCPIIPSTFSCDLEKSCIALLHAALNPSPTAAAAGGSPSPPSPSSSSSALSSPTASEVVHLIQAAWVGGERALFERGCGLLDWGHMDALMGAVMARREQEQEQRMAERKARRKGNKMPRARRSGEDSLSFATDPLPFHAPSPLSSPSASASSSPSSCSDMESASELDSYEDAHASPVGSAIHSSSASHGRRGADVAGRRHRGTSVGDDTALDLQFIQAVIATKAQAVAQANKAQAAGANRS